MLLPFQQKPSAPQHNILPGLPTHLTDQLSACLVACCALMRSPLGETRPSNRSRILHIPVQCPAACLSASAVRSLQGDPQNLNAPPGQQRCHSLYTTPHYSLLVQSDLLSSLMFLLSLSVRPQTHTWYGETQSLLPLSHTRSHTHTLVKVYLLW